MSGAILTGRESHPVLPLLSEETRALIGEERAAEHDKLRAEAMLLERQDPFRYGYEPEIWKRTDAVIAELRAEYPAGVIQTLVLGGNRASKTHFAANRVVRKMVEKPGARVWCLQSTQAASRADQQSLIFAQIPAQWRPESGKSRRGPNEKINWSQAGGFTEDTFVLPNGSQCWFKFYGANVGSLEGAELDLAWADELVPPDWVEALRFRLLTRDGLLLITFTPIEGYSGTVKQFLDGARTVEEAEAELLPILRPTPPNDGSEPPLAARKGNE